MIASLPMYDLPEIRSATDALWATLAARLDVAGALLRGGDYFETWRNPGLIFSQTCGYPFTHEFRGKLDLVATPHYAADGCEGPRYRSIVFARHKLELRAFEGQRAAFNNRDSMSGMLALKLVFQPFATAGRFFSSVVETGGHVASLAALQEDQADVAAIDCVTVALLRKHRPAALEGLHEIARAPLVPALPFVTRACDAGKLRTALAEVIADPALADAREALLLDGLSVLPSTDYEVIPGLEQAMEARGGLKLW